MDARLMIYGAAGYTGELIANAAWRLGLSPLLCGRAEAPLAALADTLDTEYRVAGLEDPARLDAALGDVAVVIHAAGPFSTTSRPMVDACLRTGTHYLDITGEIAVIEALRLRDQEARDRKLMLMPAVGFDVVASDCLAGHAAARLPAAQHLRLGVQGVVFATRGSLKTLAEYGGAFVQIRRGGTLVPTPPGSLRRAFDYGDGPRESLGVSWADVASAYYSTGIPNIEAYFEATSAVRTTLMANQWWGWALRNPLWKTLFKATADMLPEGPTPAQRESARTCIVAEVEDAEGCSLRSRLRGPEAYTFTSLTAPAIARRVLEGDLEVGFQTPARVYGPDFVLSLPEVSREDLPGSRSDGVAAKP